MRLVIQRVKEAAVVVNGSSVAEIGPGLLVLAGIHRDDTASDRNYCINKLLSLRLFDDEAGVMNYSLEESSGGLLLVSQFTLYGDTKKGRRPSWSEAMSPAEAEPFFDAFYAEVKDRYPSVQRGVFGAEMDVILTNDGPVTLIVESPRNS